MNPYQKVTKALQKLYYYGISNLASSVRWILDYQWLQWCGRLDHIYISPELCTFCNPSANLHIYIQSDIILHVYQCILIVSSGTPEEMSIKLTYITNNPKKNTLGHNAPVHPQNRGWEGVICEIIENIQCQFIVFMLPGANGGTPDTIT